MTLPPSTEMGIGLAVLESLPQRENDRDACSNQSTERERPGAAGETRSDPSRGHGRGRTLTTNVVRPGLRSYRSCLHGDLHGRWGCFLGGYGRVLSHDE